MSDLSHQPRPNQRRFWIAELLLIGGILVFGGFTLLSEARLSPTQLITDLTKIVSR
jgi:hypothetical protein